MNFKKYRAYAVRFRADGSMSAEMDIPTTDIRDCEDARAAVKKLAQNIQESPYSYDNDVVEWDTLTVRIDDPASPTVDVMSLRRKR
jgi:hypothetical protein